LRAVIAYSVGNFVELFDFFIITSKPPGTIAWE
jgi:hypothetical protein